MKRILIILTAALFSSASYSQVVMGRDIYTTSKKYAAFLATRGYKPYETVSGVKKFKVKFAGFTNVREEVHYDTSNDSITQVKFISKIGLKANWRTHTSHFSSNTNRSTLKGKTGT